MAEHPLALRYCARLERAQQRRELASVERGSEPARQLEAALSFSTDRVGGATKHLQPSDGEYYLLRGEAHGRRGSGGSWSSAGANTPHGTRGVGVRRASFRSTGK